MPALIQVCVVIVTTAIVVFVVRAIRTMANLEKSAHEIAQRVATVEGSVLRVRSLAESLHEAVTPPLRRAAVRLENVGERAASISDALLEEIETPVRNIAAVARGVRVGASMFLERLTRRLVPSRLNGGSRHV